MTTAKAYREAAAKSIALAEEIERDIPEYEHTCKNCRFLGRFKDNDLYFCRLTPDDDYYLIAKFGPGPYDEHMGYDQSKIDEHPPLLEAQRRAREAGLL